MGADWDLPRSRFTVVGCVRERCGRGVCDNNWTGHCVSAGVVKVLVGYGWGDELKACMGAAVGTELYTE